MTTQLAPDVGADTPEPTDLLINNLRAVERNQRAAVARAIDAVKATGLSLFADWDKVEAEIAVSSGGEIDVDEPDTSDLLAFSRPLSVLWDAIRVADRTLRRLSQTKRNIQTAEHVQLANESDGTVPEPPGDYSYVQHGPILHLCRTDAPFPTCGVKPTGTLFTSGNDLPKICPICLSRIERQGVDTRVARAYNAYRELLPPTVVRP